MKRIFILILIIFLSNIVFGKHSVLGQDLLGQSISKEEILSNKMDFFSAVKYSLENNNNIRSMRNGLSASERDIGIARSELLPKLVFNEDFIVTNNPSDALVLRLNQARADASSLLLNNLNYPTPITNFLTAGVIHQQIFNKKSIVKIKIAKKDYSANCYLYLRKQEELVSQVAQAYLKVETNQLYVNIAKKAIDETKHHLDIADARYKNNVGLYEDVLRAKTAVELREEKLITAQRNLNVSMRNLGLILGFEGFIEVSNTVPEIELKNINYYKSYSVYRNDLKATEIKVANAKNNITAAQAEWYPTLNAFASYNFYNNTYPFGGIGNNYIAGANFRWELFDGNKRKYDLLKAKDKEAEAKEYLCGLKKLIDFKIYEAYSNVEEHQKNFELAIKIQKEAEEDMKRVEQLWKNSQLPFVSLTDAQTNLDGARTSVVKNQFDLKEDLINLSYESGIIYQELSLKEIN